MSSAVVVRYRVRPDAAEENQRLIERVFAEWGAAGVDDVRYASLRLADGVSFVHVVAAADDADAFDASPAFAEFQRGLAERLDGPIDRSAATVVGTHRFLTSEEES